MLQIRRAEKSVRIEQQWSQGFLVEVRHYVAIEAALLGYAFEQQLIVVRDAELFRQTLADLATSAAIFPAYSYDEVLVHTVPFLLRSTLCVL